VIRLARRNKHSETAGEDADVMSVESPTVEDTDMDATATQLMSVSDQGVDGAAGSGPGDSSDGVGAAAEESAAEEANASAPGARRRGRVAWSRALVFGVLPALALMLAMGAGYFKWIDSSDRAAEDASIGSVQAATDITIKMLSYRPDTVDKDLDAARESLTGKFRDSYTALITDLVIPGSKEKKISAVATVPAAASVSASQNHAVALVFVNQTITIGSDAPSSTASAIRVTLDKVDTRWLISDFTPI
jgi:Mce-associated membrane protein